MTNHCTNKQIKSVYVRYVLLFCVIILAGAVTPVVAGDSLYGKVVEVKSATQVVFEYKGGRLDVRLVGIIAPKRSLFAVEATDFLSSMILNKKARIRIESIAKNGVVFARLFTAEPEIGIKDVAVEMLSSGMVQKIAGYDYKYGEMAAAQRQARAAKKGLWRGQ